MKNVNTFKLVCTLSILILSFIVNIYVTYLFLTNIINGSVMVGDHNDLVVIFVISLLYIIDSLLYLFYSKLGWESIFANNNDELD